MDTTPNLIATCHTAADGTHWTLRTPDGTITCVGTTSTHGTLAAREATALAYLFTDSGLTPEGDQTTRALLNEGGPIAVFSDLCCRHRTDWRPVSKTTDGDYLLDVHPDTLHTIIDTKARKAALLDRHNVAGTEVHEYINLKQADLLADWFAKQGIDVHDLWAQTFAGLTVIVNQNGCVLRLDGKIWEPNDADWYALVDVALTALTNQTAH